MKNKRKYLLIIMVVFALIVLTGCTKNTTDVYQQPILTEGSNIGLWEWIIKMLAEFTAFVSRILFNSYALGLVVMTLVVRTLGWPIYAKSNDMSTKMSLAQPDLERIQQKYAGLNDENSKRKMQMEQMQIYKKYKINILGCFLPFLQMPIFIAMYNMVRRMPITPKYQNMLRFDFLWTGFNEKDWILAILVGITMFVSQEYSMRKPKELQNVKYQSAQQQQSAKTMKIFSYVMILMMVSVSLSSAGIAFYWIIGNLYQIFQTFITRRTQTKRAEKLRKKYY